jgi:hypothetical protein
MELVAFRGPIGVRVRAAAGRLTVFTIGTAATERRYWHM